ncbi:hypothetical protein NEOKW01_2020 [Nematocida sp. AWRm80]|nr:hypothetical protein NEOKW01_2020 [Nematocida sp. AWRm80]
MARDTKKDLFAHSIRSGGHLKNHKGKRFNREKKKMKNKESKLGKIDTSVKSFKFDD